MPDDLLRYVIGVLGGVTLSSVGALTWTLRHRNDQPNMHKALSELTTTMDKIRLALELHNTEARFRHDALEKALTRLERLSEKG